MRFWQFLRFTPPDQLPGLATGIEEQSLFDGIVLGDHTIFPERIDSWYPYDPSGKVIWDPETPWPDPWVASAAMAAVTKRLHFSTNVQVLPLRNPFEMARTAATLSQMSGNRIALGTGVGWMEEEYRTVGIDFHTRGKRYDEMIDVMRLLWEGRMVEFHGEHFDFPPSQLSPKPAGHIPLYLAGASAAAMRRAARKGDGWITGGFKRKEIEGILATMRGLLKEAGRENDPFEIIVPVHANLEYYRMLRDLGVTSIIDLPSPEIIGPSTTTEEKLEYVRRFSEELIDRL